MSSLKKPLVYLSIAMLFAGAFAIAPAEAGPGHKHHKEHSKKQHRGHSMHGLKALDLSDEQKTQVKSIMKDAKEQSRANHQSLKDYKKAMNDLVNSDNYSEQAVRSLHAQYQSVFADKAVIRASTRHQINALLTAEQKAKKAAMAEKRKAHMMEKRAKMKERMEKAKADANS